MLSADIGSRRGRDALNGGIVRVHQLGCNFAGLGGGGGIWDIIIYILQIQFEGQIVLMILSVCVVDCREMLTVLPLLIVQFSVFFPSVVSVRAVPSSLYSVRQNGA